MRYLLSLLTLLFLLAGCSKQEQRMSTGKVIPAAMLPGFTGDTGYAEVNPECLPDVYDNFRSVLSRQGLVKWDERYDCNHFASLYISLAQSSYAVATWHSDTKAQTLAMAEVWYRTGPNSGHAIVQVMTKDGPVFIEPQTGKQVPAIPDNLVMLRKW